MGELRDNFNKPWIESSLTASEERSFISYMKYMADRGHPLTKRVLKQFVVAIIKKIGRPSRIDLNTGIRKSLNRHKDLKLRCRDRADKGRLHVTQNRYLR